MSEIADTPVPAAAPAAAPSAGAGIHTVREAYAFACMKCGYGWEQSYEIEHHVDGKGQPFIMYTVNGERVPSPLSNPTCMNCGGHVVRIMREGQVSSVLGMLDQLYHHRRIAPGIAGPVPATLDEHDHGHAAGRRVKEAKAAKAAREAKPPRQARAAATHDAPGPVALTPEDRGERGGLLARLKRLFRSS
ncbi:hypothetical protein ACIQUQ_13520 [Streptomyces sp. NPDC101118]|uniref:hypothetical protein n=1 Tax=Streptomyces sp. NPDC101118 TaxID=3366109 RepID=UPI0037FD97DF